MDVLTQHGDRARTGANLEEIVLAPETVLSGRFRRLHAWHVDGQQYAQPLYLSDVPYADGRVIDMVIVATMKNVVAAFEAPAPGAEFKDALWTVDSTTLGAPLPKNFTYMGLGSVILGHNISPFIGITSTPVVDRELGLVYVCAKARDQKTGDPTHYLASMDLHGKVKKIVHVPDGVSHDFAKQHLQRPALLEANGQIYIAFGAHEDHPPYGGWVFSYDRQTLAQTGSFCTTCRAGRKPGGGGIWQAGGGLAADPAGNVYAMTGNGSYDEGTGRAVGSSFLRLGPALDLLGSWTPANWACQNRTDADLGSAGPLFDERTSTLVGGGKEGILYALGPGSLLGKHRGGATGTSHRAPCAGYPEPTQNGEGYTSLQAAPKYESSWTMDRIRRFDPGGQMLGYHHIHGAPVVWRPDGDAGALLYLSAERDVLRAILLDDDGRLHGSAPGADPAPSAAHSKCPNSHHGMPGGIITLSAHGGDKATGIVWVSMPRWNQDALHRVADGALRAYRAYPQSGGSELTELWNSDRGLDIGEACGARPLPHHEPGFRFAKGAAPTVARGRVFLPTFSDELLVYGLEQVGARAEAVAPQQALLTADDPSASFPPGSLVPIELKVKNIGSRPWRAQDHIAVTCRRLSSDGETGQQSSSNPVSSETAPGAEVTVRAALIAPDEEGTHAVTCEVVGAGHAPLPGDSSVDISFLVLRTDCADLRTRRDALLAKFPPNAGPPPGLKVPTERLQAEAEARRCYLGDAQQGHLP